MRVTLNLRYIKHSVWAASLALAACSAPFEDAGTGASHPTRAVITDTSLPPIKSFRAAPAVATQRANSDLTRDFLDLSFALESGRALPQFTRFEGPILVKIEGRETATLRSDLSQLINRLRSESKIDIKLIREGSANIIIQSVAKKDIRRALPHAACFVVPNVSSLAEYRRARSASRTDWAQLQKREKLAIFLPYDTSPQDSRDCLHEELAQAIGPLNDLYRLNDSVFNDDNFHAVLTGFDMLILRAYYDPALQNGMSRTEVARALPAIFARINPQGVSAPRNPQPATNRQWINAIQSALGPTGANNRRLQEAQRAINIASAESWNDHRRGFSHYALARLLQSTQGEIANQHYRLADRYFRQSAPNGPHRSIVASQLAAYELAVGKPQEALRIVDANLDAARTYENAVQLASLLMLKSEALAALGRAQEAQASRLDSLGWARYGFGPEWAVRAKLREVASLNPKNRSF